MNQRKHYKTWCAATVCVLLVGCAVQQKRAQQGVIPAAFVPTEQEVAFGKRIFTSLSEDYPVDTGSTRYEKLSGVFNHLAESASVDPGDWRVVLFDAPEIADIRAVQGNYIFVWSGVFDAIENDDELAGLLACEMAHDLAGHTDPVEFDIGSELLFSIADAATTVGVLLLTQGMVNIGGAGVTRWAYVEAADLDPVDRVYKEEQIEDMAAIALLILEASDYSTEGLLGFWKRAGSDALFQEKVKRLSREIPPQERVVILESVLPELPVVHNPARAPTEVAEQTLYSAAEGPN
ncbi:MAG: M48 family metalloprotease [Sedimenticolaceae bacterium]